MLFGRQLGSSLPRSLLHLQVFCPFPPLAARSAPVPPGWQLTSLGSWCQAHSACRRAGSSFLSCSYKSCAPLTGSPFLSSVVFVLLSVCTSWVASALVGDLAEGKTLVLMQRAGAQALWLISQSLPALAPCMLQTRLRDEGVAGNWSELSPVLGRRWDSLEHLRYLCRFLGTPLALSFLPSMLAALHGWIRSHPQSFTPAAAEAALLRALHSLEMHPLAEGSGGAWAVGAASFGHKQWERQTMQMQRLKHFAKASLHEQTTTFLKRSKRFILIEEEVLWFIKFQRCHHFLFFADTILWSPITFLIL